MKRKHEANGALRAKLQPKLQMVANGDDEVNAVRAERCAGLRLTSERLIKTVPPRRADGDAPVTRRQIGKLPPRGKLRTIPAGFEVNVFVQLARVVNNTATLEGEKARKGNVVSARLPLNALPRLAKDPRVALIELGETLREPQPAVTAERVVAPSVSERRFGRRTRSMRQEDVLIGIIDVQGFDFTHPDFLDSRGRTRWVAIWDQGGSARPAPVDPQFAYGAEFFQTHLNEALRTAPRLGVPAYEVERQSQMAEGSHGTHVASIAAGNRGVCRRSPIAGVLISLPESDEDRRKSFYDSTRIADAVDYLRLKADEMGKQLSINISLGTNGHAHDGSGAIGRWIDSILTTPGRAATVAAGNAGQEKGETPEDFGWIMGRIHTAGVLPASGLATDIEWTVVGNGIVDISENELELWFNPQDRFAVSLRTPAGQWIGPLGPQEFIENRRLADGSFVSIYNELYHPSNGANHVAMFLSPNFRSNPVVGVPAGTWLVRLQGLEIRDGRYDGWIERDDPRSWKKEGGKELWSFPSFFSERSVTDNSTIGSLACGHRVISVANLDSKLNRVHITSSQGPTRDGRSRPDVAAPGTDVVAAKGFSKDGSQWIGMTGTSMASPFVCGVAGLMLAIEPKLTAAQIEGIVRSTAKPLPGASFRWVNDAGYGVIDPQACLEQAANVNSHLDRTDD